MVSNHDEFDDEYFEKQEGDLDDPTNHEAILTAEGDLADLDRLNDDPVDAAEALNKLRTNDANVEGIIRAVQTRLSEGERLKGKDLWDLRDEPEFNETLQEVIQEMKQDQLSDNPDLIKQVFREHLIDDLVDRKALDDRYKYDYYDDKEITDAFKY